MTAEGWLLKLHKLNLKLSSAFLEGHRLKILYDTEYLYLLHGLMRSSRLNVQSFSTAGKSGFKKILKVGRETKVHMHIP